MDPKKQIEDALAGIGQDRKWLAEASGYSYFSVRDCLAPEGKKLSPRMYNALLAAITRCKAPDPPPTPPPTQTQLPDRLTIFCEPKQRLSYELSAGKAHLSLSRWIIDELDKAAVRWNTPPLRSVKAAKKA